MAAKLANKKQQEKKDGERQKAHSMLLAKQGIARNSAESLLKSRDEEKRLDDDLKKDREEDISNEEKDEEKRLGGKSNEDRIDGVVKGHDDKASEQSGQNANSQGGSSQGGGSSPDQQGSKGREQQGGERDKAGKVESIKKQPPTVREATELDNDSQSKVIIGKTLQAQASERINPRVIQAVADRVYQLISDEGMKEFQIELKDDMLGGGVLRVSLKDSGLKLTFTMKDHLS